MEDKMAVNAGEPFLLQFTIANKTDYSIHIDSAQLFLVRVVAFCFGFAIFTQLNFTAGCSMRIGMTVWSSSLLISLKFPFHG